MFSKDDGLDGAGAAALPGVLQALHQRGVSRPWSRAGRRPRAAPRAVDRAIVVRAPVAFDDEPVPSGTPRRRCGTRPPFRHRGGTSGEARHAHPDAGAHAPLWGMRLDEPP